MLLGATGLTLRGAAPPADSLPPDLATAAIPRGLDPNRPVPRDNPLSDAKVRLGRRLFFDPLLSRDRSVACASCHDPGHGFAGRDPLALGIEGKKGRRNAPRSSTAPTRPACSGTGARRRRSAAGRVGRR